MKKLAYLVIAISLLVMACKEDKNVPLERIALGRDVVVFTGTTQQIPSQLFPFNATQVGLTWQSSKPDIASVDQNGLVTAYDTPGKIFITAATEDGRVTDTGSIDVRWANRCDNEVPGWGSRGLGTVGFISANTWVVTNGNLTQEWSDLVNASICETRTAFNGGVGTTANNLASYSADCRNRSYTLKGSLFSWCAVVRFQDSLCPDGWRVPTAEDFIILDSISGGKGLNVTQTAASETEGRRDNFYLNATSPGWGGIYAGYTEYNTTTGLYTVQGSGSSANYWSLSESNADAAYDLNFTSSLSSVGSINPKHWTSKSRGMAVRCIKE